MKRRYLTRYGRSSFSQEGEDILLDRFLQDVKHGFYVDVGAHHPKRFSNTYYFYSRGWNGINVDAMPGSMEEFGIFRRRDVNLERAVSETPGTLTFHVFNEPALNTFDAALVEPRVKAGYSLVETKEVLAERLETILDRSLPPGQAIDFLSVDVEGFDFAVLKSNNWVKYRPRFILVECLQTNPLTVVESPTYRYLSDLGYEYCAKTMNTFFFRDAQAH